jgi:Fe-S-cluster containining protein
MEILNLQQLSVLVSKSKKSTTDLFAKLKKKKPSNLDSTAEKIHNKLFQDIDCLECANCCKNISPIIKDSDIVRIAKFLKMKPADLTQKYMYLDNDGDYVYKQTPCPFLLSDNYCSIYNVRPNACKEYPHTDRKRFYQILDLTSKNATICPEVYYFIEELKKEKF